MVQSPSKDWKKTLTAFLNKVDKPALDNGHPWLIIGSLASALQGLKIQPNDIDIIVKKAESVYFICSLLQDYYAKENKAQNPFTSEEIWMSTKEKPVDESTDQWGFQWVFARLLIEGMYVEIALIESPKGYLDRFDGIWEAGSQSWSYIHRVKFDRFEVPVIPLEIQLETNFGRGFDERINQIVHLLEKGGYDNDLLDKALSKQHRIKFNQLITHQQGKN